MFRIAVPRVAVARSAIGQKSFVSSVLLTRTWANESVADLKREAKVRGLSPKGNKANLILRIQEHDKTKTFEAIASHDPPGTVGARVMSTDTSSDKGVTPGIPPASQPIRYLPEALMNTNIPDISQPDSELPIQIPYVPDFWASSSSIPPEIEPPLPKLLVVAGADTHPGGGPSHNLHDENAPMETLSTDASPSTTKEVGLWDDIAEDLGIPSPREIRTSFWKVFS